MLTALVVLLVALFVYSRPTMDPVRLRARRTGALGRADHVAHRVAVRKRRIEIARQKRDFARRLRAHLGRCEIRWRENGWRDQRENLVSLEVYPKA